MFGVCGEPSRIPVWMQGKAHFETTEF